MEVQVEASDDEGNRREYVGIEICRGPGVMRVLLTRPFGSAGETVDLPLDRVRSVAEVESGVLGEPVRRVNGKERADDRDPNRS